MYDVSYECCWEYFVGYVLSHQDIQALDCCILQKEVTLLTMPTAMTKMYYTDSQGWGDRRNNTKARDGIFISTRTL